MDGASKQQGILKENGNRKDTSTQNQEKATEIYCTHNEDLLYSNCIEANGEGKETLT